MTNTPRQVLLQLVQQFGDSIADNPPKILGLLKDYCPEYKLETNLLVDAIKSGIPAYLLAGKNLPFAVLESQMISHLKSTQGLSEKNARWVVETWGVAFSLLPASKCTTPDYLAIGSQINFPVSAPKVDRKFEAWKQDLYDFSKRNPLLYYKATQSSTLEINIPRIEKLFERIVIKGDRLAFAQYRTEYTLIPSDIGQPKRYVTRYIQESKGDLVADKTEGPLIRCLNNIRNSARSSRNELGLNSLYIGFGLLRWIESNSSAQINSAPLILVPADIERVEGRDKYVLSYFEEDVLLNPTLAAFLVDPRFNYNLALPDIQDDQDLDLLAYIDEVEKVISSRGWFVDKSVVIRLFSFQTIRLGRDLDEARAMSLYPPIIRMLAGETVPATSKEAQLEDLDSIYKPDDFFQVLDADASQIRSLAASKSGQHLVIQGPPGTGKSQTIVNLIAQAILDNKTVLFVSQKKAALDVVFRRLKQLGLDPMCLQAHSEKANKKAVLDELQQVYLYQQHNGTVFKESDYELLYNDRGEINKIARLLNQPIGQLGLTIHQVMGELVQLDTVPAIRSSFVNQHQLDMSHTDWIKITNAAKQYVYTYQQLDCLPGEHPWKYLGGKGLDVPEPAEIQLDLEEIRELRIAIEGVKQKTTANLRLPKIDNLQELAWVAAVISSLGSSPMLLQHWLSENNGAELQKLIEDGQLVSSRINQGKNYLISEGIGLELLNENTSGIFDTLYQLLAHLKKIFTNSSEYSQRTKRNEALKNLSATISTSNRTWALILKVRGLLENPALSSSRDFSWIAKLFDISSSISRPIASWFDLVELATLTEKVTQLEQAVESITKLRAKILSSWHDGALSLDFSTFVPQVQNDYSSGLKRFFSQDYKKLCQSVTVLWKGNKRVKYQHLLELSTDLQKYEKLINWFSKADLYFETKIGSRYQGEKTDFNEIREQFDLVKKITLLFNGLSVPPVYINCLTTNNLSSREWIALRDEMLAYEQSSPESFKTISHMFHATLVNVVGTENDIYIDRLITLTQQAEKILVNLDQFLAKLCSLMSVDDVSFDRMFEILKLFGNIRNDLQSFRNSEDQYKAMFGTYFRGLTTDWETLKQAVHFAQDFKQLLQNGNPNEEQKPVGSDFSAFFSGFETFTQLQKSARDILPEVLSVKGDAQASIQKFRSYFVRFDENFSNDDFSLVPFNQLFTWADNLYDQIAKVPAWKEYRYALDELDLVGLSSIEQEAITNKKYHIDLFEEIVRKRYLQLWLEEVYLVHKEIKALNIGAHERKIEQFKELDKKLMHLQSAKVLQNWQSNLPALNATPSSQAGILAREFNKKRAHIPLRKLFAKTPDLLLKLKPCILMSPLSVAAYLPLEQFRELFDMVIFDEASQVKPAFAIGAMLRTKQVIVAGDLKQLPPTDFFHVTGDLDIESEDEDLDEDDDAVPGQLESILGEFDSLSGIEQCRLLWHYRSRHEALIHFSNQNYYGKTLITFPSPLTNSHEISIRSHYVRGIYDRGKTRQNLIEAQKVVELIKNHLRDFKGKRSLGVITLSIAQENAIRDQIALEFSNGNNPDLITYRELLNEDANIDEPFFVKSLEKVQGDERDTIILSIGYGPDANGRMAQTFGPINLMGGERRLNVAVTRAKHQMNVVTSILSDDIRLSENSKVGLRNLKEYLFYCQQHLQSQNSRDSAVDPGSFEEHLYQLLVGWGYKVDRNIGMSGFRIDLAVQHPDQTGSYLAGIICDGKNYDSAETARDRERLRLEILQNMGWNIIRLWVKEWMVKPTQATKALRDSLENALVEWNNQTEAEIRTIEPEFQNIETNAENIISRLEQDVVKSNAPVDIDWRGKIRIEEYREYQPASKINYYLYGHDQPVELELIKRIVEVEQPIHPALLYDRFRMCYGLDGTSSYQKRIFDQILSNALRSNIVIEKEKFIFGNPSIGEVVPRRPKKGGSPRRIEQISLDEIAALLIQVIKHVYGISRNELIKETSSLLGYPNASVTRKERIELALNSLIKQKIVRVNGESVIPATIN